MAKRPRILDLFCGAGGCAVGYHRAGFDVVGVDNAPQPRYPFPFIRDDALAVLTRFLMGGPGATAIDAQGRHWGLDDFQAIHASPPCQRFSMGAFLRGDRRRHPDLVSPTRQLLIDMGKPRVIENVPRAPLSFHSLRLCGLMFGLKVFRHRLFESNFLMLAPPHPPHGQRRIGVGGYVCVAGSGDSGHKRVPADHRNKASWVAAMGIDWMIYTELAQAIPPTYTRYVGLQLRNALEGASHART